MPLNVEYKGYMIRQALSTGGKAGKGHNKTSSFLIHPKEFRPGNYKTVTIRFKVGNPASYQDAIAKAKAWIDARADEDEAHRKAAEIEASYKPVIDAASAAFAEMRPSDFCGCYEGDLTDDYPDGVEEFIKRLTNNLKAAGVKIEVRNA